MDSNSKILVTGKLEQSSTYSMTHSLQKRNERLINDFI